MDGQDDVLLGAILMQRLQFATATDCNGTKHTPKPLDWVTTTTTTTTSRGCANSVETLQTEQKSALMQRRRVNVSSTPNEVLSQGTDADARILDGCDSIELFYQRQKLAQLYQLHEELKRQGKLFEQLDQLLKMNQCFNEAYDSRSDVQAVFHRYHQYSGSD